MFYLVTLQLRATALKHLLTTSSSRYTDIFILPLEEAVHQCKFFSKGFFKVVHTAFNALNVSGNKNIIFHYHFSKELQFLIEPNFKV